MKGFLTKFVMIMILLTLAACAGKPLKSDNTKDTAQLEQLLTLYESAVNTGDVGMLMSLYSMPAVQIAPDEPAIEGLIDIRERAEANHAYYRYQLKSKIDDIRVDLNSATIMARYSERFANRNDSSEFTDTSGLWLLLLDKQADGSWKIRTEIWHHDEPVSAM